MQILGNGQIGHYPLQIENTDEKEKISVSWLFKTETVSDSLGWSLDITFK